MRYRDFFLITEDNKLASLNNLKKKFDDAIAQEWHQKLLDLDPTKDKPNPSFIGKLTKFFLENPSDDQFNKIKEAFEKFLLLSKRHIWKRDAEPKDINQYKQFLKFAGEVHRVYGKNLDSLGIEQDKKVEKTPTGELDKIFGIHFDPKHVMYQDEDVISVRVDNPKESIRYGSKFGKWCTTWKRNNYFYSYKFDDEFDTPANMYFVYFPKRYSANNKDPKAVLHFGRDEEGNISYTDRHNDDDYQDLDWLQKKFPEELGGKDMSKIFPYQEIPDGEKEFVELGDIIPDDQFINFSDTEKMLYIQMSNERVINLNKFNGMSREMQEQYLGFCENNEIPIDLVVLSQIYENAMGKRYLSELSSELDITTGDEDTVFENIKSMATSAFGSYNFSEILKYKDDILNIPIIVKYIKSSGDENVLHDKFNHYYFDSYKHDIIINIVNYIKTHKSDEFIDYNNSKINEIIDLLSDVTDGLFSFPIENIENLLISIKNKVELNIRENIYRDNTEESITDFRKYFTRKSMDIISHYVIYKMKYTDSMPDEVLNFLNTVSSQLPNDVPAIIEYLKSIHPDTSKFITEYNEYYELAAVSIENLALSTDQIMEFIEQFKSIDNLNDGLAGILLSMADSNFYEIYQKLITTYDKSIDVERLNNYFFGGEVYNPDFGSFIATYEFRHKQSDRKNSSVYNKELLLDLVSAYTKIIPTKFNIKSMFYILSAFYYRDDYTEAYASKLYNILQSHTPVLSNPRSGNLQLYTLNFPYFSFNTFLSEIASNNARPTRDRVGGDYHERIIEMHIYQLPFSTYTFKNSSDGIYTLLSTIRHNENLRLFVKKHINSFLSKFGNEINKQKILDSVGMYSNLTESTFKKHLKLMHAHLNGN